MSFFTHHNRHSWPLFSNSQEFPSAADIDDDPFSYFLSPPSPSIDPFLDEDVSNAGISRPGSKPPPLEADTSVSKASKTTSAVLRRWASFVERSNPSLHLRYHPPTTIPTRTVSQPNLQLAAEQTFEYNRGRPLIRPHPNSQRRVRSHSNRPRAWRKPSEKLFVLVEEDEGAAHESEELAYKRMATSAFDFRLPEKPASPPNSASWMRRHFGGRKPLICRL
ncbi:MAG: hypothetical protein M1829_005715 [Trizodia sp. TS-e1964]|nr:MAG: hypothetical protein M1829_005715 [Trizodia sp. TS-e1964]